MTSSECLAGDVVDAATAATAAPALEVCDLVKRYGERTAVDRLSFTVERGRVFALLGPNGAGKTSTVETCEGFRHADGGTVRVLGLDPVRDAAALRPRVGVMPQDGGAYQGARAAEMLRLVARYARNPLDPEALLDMLGLRAVAHTPYRRLSGGQRQRLSLAMSVVSRPEVVFLDEPTAGLDPQARRATWEIVEALRSDGVTVLLTTHYMEEAERLADQVLVIDHGRSVATGTPSELTRSGAAGQLRFTAPPDLDLAAMVATLPAGALASELAPGSYLVEGPVHPQLLAALTAWCAERNVLVAELRVERRSLEDVFLELTGRELRS
ncbi:MAG TPA: ABC transporter ATP-binding protein [Mycobacteriales bacterium]|nr:ABC transporter ATP-binding protein [Mycobacteriales bacterium]